MSAPLLGNLKSMHVHKHLVPALPGCLLPSRKPNEGLRRRNTRVHIHREFRCVCALSFLISALLRRVGLQRPRALVVADAIPVNDTTIPFVLHSPHVLMCFLFKYKSRYLPSLVVCCCSRSSGLWSTRTCTAARIKRCANFLRGGHGHCALSISHSTNFRSEGHIIREQ